MNNPPYTRFDNSSVSSRKNRIDLGSLKVMNEDPLDDGLREYLREQGDRFQQRYGRKRGPAEHPSAQSEGGRKMEIQAITAEVIYAVLWLGCQTGEGLGRPIGSGVVIHHEGHEYLATALHVAVPCAFNPLVRRNGKWRTITWERVVTDEALDIAVLRTSQEHVQLSSLTPSYGAKAGTSYGSIGRALGFPALSAEFIEPGMAERMIQELDGGHPIPVPVVVTVSFVFNRDTMYTGGYVNSGFSGGAIVYPTAGKQKHRWSIAGIITERGGVLKSTGIDEGGKHVVIMEPTGMVKFTRMESVLALIDRAADKNNNQARPSEENPA